MKTLQKALKQLEKAEERVLLEVDKLKGTATNEETCPLNQGGKHYAITEKLFGIGHWRWKCPICGTEHQE